MEFWRRFFDQTEKKSRISSEEIGRTGTEIFSGMITGEEYNSDLQGQKGIKTYDKMRRSDATVGVALLAVKLPILAARARITPATSSEEDIKIADFVEACLFEKMEMGWQEFLRQALLMLDFGHMPFEKVFQIVEVDGKEYIGWKKFGPRLPKSIQKWEISNGKPGITQLVMGNSYEIPMEKLMVFINQKEGDNYEGTSLLRQAYKHWYFKENFYKIDAMAFERQGMGIPIMKLPPNFDDSDKTRATNILRNIRANEQAYLLIPNGWEFEFADMKAGSARDPEKSILHHDRQITKSVLAQFIELGASGGSGSRALSEDHSDLFYMAERSVAQNIADIINKNAIKELVDMNFNVTYYPKLEFANIGKVDFDRVATAVGTLVEKGIFLADQGLEDYLRDQMGLPEAPEENKEIREKKQEMAMNPPSHTSGGDSPTPPLDKKSEGEGDGGGNKGKLENEADKREKGRGEAEKAKNAKKKASETNPSFVAWRPITFAEQKIDWRFVQGKITELEKNFIADTKRVLEEASPVLLEEFKELLKKKDIEGIKNLALAYKGPYRKEVLRNLLAAYEFGKRGASKEMGKPFPETPEADQQRIELLANTIVDMHESEILKGMKLTAIKELRNGKKPEQVVNTIAVELGRLTDRLSYNTAIATVGGSYNEGRMAAFLANEENIYALQRSEILDGRVCNYCLSMDGRIVGLKDPIAKATIFHSSCRGIWVQIMIDEYEKPPIDGVPDSIAKRWKGAPNDFEQLDKPITTPGTLADDFASKHGFSDTCDCGHLWQVVK